MVARGFAGGLAEGFGTGLELGLRAQENRTKRDILLRERIDQQVNNATSLFSAQFKTLADTITNSAQRSPGLETAIEAQKAQLSDMANMVAQLGTPEAQMAAQSMQAQLGLIPTLKTKSEQFSEDIQSKMSALKGSQTAPATTSQQSQSQAGAVFSPPATITAQTQQPQSQPMPMQAQATTQLTGQQQPIAAVTDFSQIPEEDIELVIADPTAQEEFKQEYGIDPNRLLGDPERPGSKITDDEIMSQLMNVDPFTPERKAMAQEEAKSWKEKREKMEEARTIIRSNYEQRRLLDSGILSGLGADWRLFLERAKAYVGDEEAQKLVARTESFVLAAGNKVGILIKQFGAGTGLSDEDRRIAYQLAAGDITLNEETLREILRITTRASLWVLNNPGAVRPMSDADISADAARLGVDLTPDQFKEFTGVK